jgi:hypothetical protein
VVVCPLIRAPQHRDRKMKWILHLTTFGACRDLEKETAHNRLEQGTDINSKAEGCIGSHLSVFFCHFGLEFDKSGVMMSAAGFIP